MNGDGSDGNPRPVPKEYKQKLAKRFHIHSWTIGEAFKEMEQYEKEGPGVSLQRSL